MASAEQRSLSSSPSSEFNGLAALRSLSEPARPSVERLYATVDTARRVEGAGECKPGEQVVEPVVKLDDARQKDFNVDTGTAAHGHRCG
jgi:hypothetical protein